MPKVLDSKDQQKIQKLKRKIIVFELGLDKKKTKDSLSFNDLQGILKGKTSESEIDQIQKWPEQTIKDI